MSEEGSKIRDADLLAKLEEARGGLGFDVLQRVLERSQAKRDEDAAREAIRQEAEIARQAETAARRKSMTKLAKRRDELREQVAAEPADSPDKLQHIHSVLALCGLPYRALPDDTRDYERSYGKMTLAVSAGKLADPSTKRMELQGIPYGPKARLLLLHLCTQAIKQRSPEIEIKDSLSAFIRDMGFPVTGGKGGTLTQFKEQLNRLAACRMQIGLFGDNNTRTIDTNPIRSFEVWLPRHPDQKIFWSSTVTFNRDFYDTLTEHALPVDIRAVRAFAGSARKLDLIFWIGYRMRKLERPAHLSWDILFEQFAGDLQRMARFKAQLKDDLADIHEVFPKLTVKLTDNGMTLLPCDPKLLLVPPRRIISAR